MRLLLEIAVIAALLALGWETSFKERVSASPLIGRHLASTRNKERVQAMTAGSRPDPSISPSGAWMRDPNHHTALDHPAFKNEHVFSGHIYYTDDKGVQYWLDAQGQRHYQK